MKRMINNDTLLKRLEMKSVLITICLLLFAGCSLPKSSLYQGVEFPSLAQMQGRIDRESILKGLRIIMNDPTMYRILENEINSQIK